MGLINGNIHIMLLWTNMENSVFIFAKMELSNFLGQLFSRALVYTCQNFFKGVVHVIVIDQCNQTVR